MSIQILSQSATLSPLNDQGVVGRPLSEPPCRMRGLDITLAGAGNNGCGLWECNPGRFERQIAEAEVMHILSGICSFTPTGGEPLEITAGDTLFFPANTTGVWHIRETLRKVYVVFASQA
ncbi:cupin domain-containing protein [Polaromonas jejuensis]|uniref:Cupin domain-containing protein n=1 Tax=Polaromonas jejuensis TaxID=457502 RepID=A0ABW0QFF7_9BURK|nr:cupin domain-containing protein [Polaromonas jejuensis]